MINAFIKGQELKLMYPVIASNTINYLELTAHFQTADWRSLDEVYAIFQKEGESIYEIKLDEFGQIKKDRGLNLQSGNYKVHFIGKTMDEGVPNPKITTIQSDLIVNKSGADGGEDFPSVTPTERDRIVQMIGDLNDLETKEKENLVSAINEVNKNTSVQSDFLQNNPESKDYIKNRTHYFENGFVRKRTIVENGNLFVASLSDFVIELKEPIAPGKTLEVIVGGESYIAETKSFLDGESFGENIIPFCFYEISLKTGQSL